MEFSDSSASTEPSNGKADAARVAKGPSGDLGDRQNRKHVRQQRDEHHLQVDADVLNMSFPIGQSCSAKLDGYHR
jgi:hypothetical protein